MKKTCLNCAFCMRCQDKHIWTGANLVSNDTQALLTPSERAQAQKGDFSFIGAEKRARNAWIEKYNQNLDALKQGHFNPIFGGPVVLELLQAQEQFSTINGNPFPLREQFNMPECPAAPDADYMACWHKQWGPLSDKQDLASLNQPTKCFFFYPYTRKGNKTFDGCEKEREAALSAKRFCITNGLVIAGIVVTLFSMGLTFYIYEAQKQDAQLTDKTLQKALSTATTQAANTQQILTDIQTQLNALSAQEKKDE